MVEILTILIVGLLAKLHLLVPILIVGVLIWLVIKTETGKFIAALALVGVLWVVARCS